MKKLQALLVTIGVLLSVTAGTSTAADQSIDPMVASLGPGFAAGDAQVNGTSIHYVRGGHGPAIVLIHGFPQDWSEYRQIMPQLAKNYTVISVDLRGVGKSAPATDGFDTTTMAEDIHQLDRKLGLGHVYVVGHDIGGMVAYAYARDNPKETRGVMVLDVPVPGITPWTEITSVMWHIGFHQVPNLPEELISGRQELYFRYILNTDHFTDADVAYYASVYRSPQQLHAGLGFYRAFPQDATANAAKRSSTSVPLFWATGANSFFPKFESQVVAGFKGQGWKNVSSEIIEGADHFVVNDQPQVVEKLIATHAAVR